MFEWIVLASTLICGPNSYNFNKDDGSTGYLILKPGECLAPVQISTSMPTETKGTTVYRVIPATECVNVGVVDSRYTIMKFYDPTDHDWKDDEYAYVKKLTGKWFEVSRQQTCKICKKTRLKVRREKIHE